MLLSGSLNTITLKLQSLTPVDSLRGTIDIPKVQYFYHPFIQTFFMFVGEFLCLFLHALNEWRENQRTCKKVQILPRKAPLLYFIIPASLDLLTVGLMNVALSMLEASTHQMLKGGNILVTALMGIIFMRAKVFKFHWTSMLMIFLGLFLVGAQDSLIETGAAQTSTLGVVMILIGQFADATQNTVQAKFMKKFRVEPLQQVGLEGFWGLIVTALFLLAAQYIPCSHPELCQDGSLDNVSKALQEFDANHYLILLTLFACLTSIFYNGFALYITKHGSATQTCTIDISRTSLIWLFFLVVPINGLYESITLPKVAGFLLITIGTVFYNEIFKIPCFSYKHVYQFRSVNKSLDVSTIVISRSMMRYASDDSHDDEGDDMDHSRGLREPLLGKGKR
ncbi:hypothetical protein FGO68_gene9495 [Halteria grandinella]|uniref:Uncharacterized protein n=1 Tax=Halteria grandinella TaxID=5974 RepID=A0A8J8NMZ8_HALGN|nr:hypothetical protein FGO68_gene9495 [Halteria grandinella]